MGGGPLHASVPDAQGKPLLFQGVLLDITARKEAEASEEQFRELIDSSPVVSWVYESTRTTILLFGSFT